MLENYMASTRFVDIEPWAAATASRLPIRQSRRFAGIASNLLSAPRHPVSAPVGQMVPAAVLRKQAQRVAELFPEGRAITFADLCVLAFGLIAAAIFAPTASLAARSGSAERCA